MNQTKISTKPVAGNFNAYVSHGPAIQWCADTITLVSNDLLKQPGVLKIISASHSIITNPDTQNRGYTASVIITYERRFY